MKQGTSGHAAATGSARSRHQGRRLLSWVLVMGIIGGAIGLGLGLLRGDANRASASMLIAPLDGNPFRPGGRGDDLTNLLSEAELVSSDAVTHTVIQSEGSATSVAEMRSGLEVDVPANTQVIQVTYTAPSADLAVSRAQAFVDAYLAFRANQAEDLIDRRTERITDQLQERNQELRALFRQRAAAADQPAREALITRQIETIAGEVSVLRSQQAELLTTSLYPGDVVRPATVTSAGLLANPATFAVVGAVVGALLGLALGLLRGKPRGRLRHAEDVAAAGVPLLGTLTPASAEGGRVAYRSGDDSGVAHSADQSALRAALLNAHPSRPATVLLAQAGTSLAAPSAAVGIALALAAAEYDVVLVDATGSGRGLTDELGETGATGLSEVLLNRAGLADAVVTRREHLTLLPSGEPTERLDDLVASDRMRTLIGALRQRAQVVLVATGSIHHGLGQSLALLADSVVLEVAEGNATFADLVDAVGPESTVGPKVAGAVFVGHADARQHRFDDEQHGPRGSSADAAEDGRAAEPANR